MPQNTEITTLKSVLQDLKRRIRTLETAPRLASASIDYPGRVAVRREDGSTIALIGTDDNGQTACQFLRADGSLAGAMILWPGNAAESFSLFDPQGNEIVGTDTVAGQGLARPWLPVPFESADMSSAPSTTSASFVAASTAHYYKKQQAKMDVVAWAMTDAGTAGEVRMYDVTANAQLGSTQSIGAGAFVEMRFDVAVSGDHLTERQIDLQFRRTAGTGLIRARVMGAYGEHA